MGKMTWHVNIDVHLFLFLNDSQQSQFITVFESMSPFAHKSNILANLLYFFFNLLFLLLIAQMTRSTSITHFWNLGQRK